MKNGKLTITLKATCNGNIQTRSKEISCEPKGQDWVDVNINRCSRHIDMLWRLDLRPEGDTPAFYPALALDGVKKHWTRTQPFNLQFSPSGAVQYTVETTALNGPEPTMNEDFEIIHNLMETEAEWERSYSITFFPVIGKRKIYYNDRTSFKENSKPGDDIEYLHTSAHEVGHVVLKHAYSREHSWEHQGTSTLFSQKELPDSPVLPGEVSDTEVELMWYYQDWAKGQKYESAGIASKLDIRGSI